MIRRLGFLGVSLLLLHSAGAENTRPADTPPIVQVTLGPTYRDLPADGGMYCVPTSNTMALFWLNTRGFTTLAPAFSETAAYDLDRVIAGLMQTGLGPKGGTTNANERAGMEMYLNLKGLSGHYQSEYVEHPESAALTSALEGDYQFAVVNISWFKQSGTSNVYVANSGHDVTLLDYVSTGTYTGTATINNPEPRSLYDVQNIPSEVQQTVFVAPVADDIILVGNSGTLTADYQQFITPTHTGSGHLAVINDVSHWTINVGPHFVPTTFVLTQSGTINTNGGSFTAEAPLADGGNGYGLTKIGSGTMTLSGSSNATTGTWTVAGGTLDSTLTTDGVTPATPYGTGQMVITGGATLGFRPDLSTAAPGSRDVSLLLASGSGSTLTIASGHGALDLVRGGNDSLTITIGGNADGSSSNLFLQDHSTLSVQVGEGLSALGTTTRLLVSGSAGNLPAVTNGIVTPAIIGQQNDSARSGVFLTYDTASGFAVAAVTSGTSFSATGDTTIFATSGAIDLAPGSTATIGALIADHDITGGADSTLQITPDGATSAGLILNGATVSVSALSFGDRDAYIYSNATGGIVTSSITAASLTTFGPGETILGGTTAVISGTVSVNSGTLTVANQGIGNAASRVRANAVLNVSGTVSGSISVADGGRLSLSGGEVTGALDLAATSALDGSGQITYSTDTVVAGTLGATDAAGRLTFRAATESATLSIDSEAIFNFTLTSTSGNTPGVDWNFYDFQHSVDATEGFTVYLNFLASTDPADLANAAYWSLDHEWNLMYFADGTAPDVANILMPEKDLFYTGSFTLFTHTGTSGHGEYLSVRYNAVPEPSAIALVALAAASLFFLRSREKRAVQR